MSMFAHVALQMRQCRATSISTLESQALACLGQQHKISAWPHLHNLPRRVIDIRAMTNSRSNDRNPQDGDQRKRADQHNDEEGRKQAGGECWQKGISSVFHVFTPSLFPRERAGRYTYRKEDGTIYLLFHAFTPLYVKGQIDIHIGTYNIVYLSVSFYGYSGQN